MGQQLLYRDWWWGWFGNHPIRVEVPMTGENLGVGRGFVMRGYRLVIYSLAMTYKYVECGGFSDYSQIFSVLSVPWDFVFMCLIWWRRVNFRSHSSPRSFGGGYDFRTIIVEGGLFFSGKWLDLFFGSELQKFRLKENKVFNNFKCPQGEIAINDVINCITFPFTRRLFADDLSVSSSIYFVRSSTPVSYTHLTLPTIYSV